MMKPSKKQFSNQSTKSEIEIEEQKVKYIKRILIHKTTDKLKILIDQLKLHKES